MAKGREGWRLIDRLGSGECPGWRGVESVYTRRVGNTKGERST